MEEKIELSMKKLNEYADKVDLAAFEKELMKLVDLFNSNNDEKKIEFYMKISPAVEALKKELKDKMTTIEDIRLVDSKSNEVSHKYSKY